MSKTEDLSPDGKRQIHIVLTCLCVSLPHSYRHPFGAVWMREVLGHNPGRIIVAIHPETGEPIYETLDHPAYRSAFLICTPCLRILSSLN